MKKKAPKLISFITCLAIILIVLGIIKIKFYIMITTIIIMTVIIIIHKTQFNILNTQPRLESELSIFFFRFDSI